jgi:predicted NAD-dependent protein-ADP-ribosyltransferase YbiA (DUF1768 family)
MLVEDSPKDDFWGWGPNKDGCNQLGKVWMKLRGEDRKWRKENGGEPADFSKLEN